MINYTLNSAHAEGAKKNNAPKQIKAKEIFLGIDAHLKSNQVALCSASFDICPIVKP